jgi:DNA repair protein RadA
MELFQLGMDEDLLEHLKENGFDSVEKLALALPEDLAQKLSLKLSTAKQLVQSAKNAIILNFRSALEMLEERQRVERIPTGSKDLDRILGGGVEVGAITEFFGEYGSGKSQIAHQLCVNVQLIEGNKKAVFVDTEGSFRPERILQMARRAASDPKDILKGILVVRVYDTDQQTLVVRKLGDMIKQVGLLVIDSISNLFRSEYSGRESLAQRQQKLCRHLADLKRVAEVDHLAVVITNQVLARPEIFGDPTSPVGGNILGHAVTHRVYLRRGKGEARTAIIVDSPNLPCLSANFRITEDGISD